MTSVEDTTNTTVMQKVLLALESLGYKDKDVTRLVSNQLTAGFNSSEELIKNILREL